MSTLTICHSNLLGLQVFPAVNRLFPTAFQFYLVPLFGLCERRPFFLTCVDQKKRIDELKQSTFVGTKFLKKGCSKDFYGTGSIRDSSLLKKNEKIKNEK